ncbi:hypothetical protein [Streptomyces otsuchiensis]|uniref:hypothetical protein n=1 Tax=Streptomyces otsuchiensis TaxID=2681388 RepID=UPI00102F72BD|nr:hypothetical protein [Streptomyces otsuchiensis]
MTDHSRPARRWTSEHLMQPGGTGMYVAQQRERLRQMADEIHALQSEYRSDLETVDIEGDRPLEARVRAYLASRPLAQLERDLRHAVNHIKRLETEHKKRFEELPKKRRQKAIEKDEKKGRKAISGPKDATARDTSRSLAEFTGGIVQQQKSKKDDSDETSGFFDALKKGA